MLTNIKLHLNDLSIPGESLAARYRAAARRFEKHCPRSRLDVLDKRKKLLPDAGIQIPDSKVCSVVVIPMFEEGN